MKIVYTSLAEDINMPSMFLCGGFQNVVQNVIMWFSSGGTKSVLHNDGLDNVNCLIDGEKYLVMIDKVNPSILLPLNSIIDIGFN